jgi:exodeoxyribonuclease-3
VAILSRSPLADIERGFGDGGDESQARFVAATTAGGIRVMSVYVPNGEAVGSEKFAYKLAWCERLVVYLEGRLTSDAPSVVCGDFNVAPAEIDVHDPASWQGHVLFSAEERAAFRRIIDCGLIDIVRQLNPQEPMYSWWDYRQLAFPKNRGLRIDHLLLTPALARRAGTAHVDRNARKGKLPSDHAPVVVEVAAA